MDLRESPSVQLNMDGVVHSLQFYVTLISALIYSLCDMFVVILENGPSLTDCSPMCSSTAQRNYINYSSTVHLHGCTIYDLRDLCSKLKDIIRTVLTP